MSWTVRMLGWFNDDAASASRSNWRSRSASAEKASGRTLTATPPPSRVSRPRYTSPSRPRRAAKESRRGRAGNRSRASWPASRKRLERPHSGDGVVIPVVVEQMNAVFDGDLGDNTIKRASHRESPPAAVVVDPRRGGVRGHRIARRQDGLSEQVGLELPPLDLLPRPLKDLLHNDRGQRDLEASGERVRERFARPGRAPGQKWKEHRGVHQDHLAARSFL